MLLLLLLLLPRAAANDVTECFLEATAFEPPVAKPVVLLEPIESAATYTTALLNNERVKLHSPCASSVCCMQSQNMTCSSSEPSHA